MNNNTKERLLWAAMEDYVGLWDVLGEMDEERDDCAAGRRAVEELLEGGLVSAYRELTPDGELAPLAEADARASLADASTWLPPGPSTCAVRIGATPAGEAEYARLYRVRTQGDK